MMLKLLATGLLIVGAFFAGQAFDRAPQDDKAPMKQPSPEEIAKMQEEYAKAGMPGEAHKRLATLVGKWDQKVTMTMPAMPKSEVNWTSEYKSILGGRFIVQEMSGKMSMPGPDGKSADIPFNGFQVLGYDNTQKLYQSLWCDSMGTGMFTSTGKIDASGTITYEGVMKDALTPQGRPWRMTGALAKPDEHYWEMFDAMDGKNYVKVMTIVETRAK